MERIDSIRPCARGYRAWTLCLLALGLAACGDGRLQNATASLTVEPPLLEFGLTNLSSPKTIELKLQNNGRSPLFVQSLTSSLPNVAVQAMDSFDLLAGEKRTVRVTFAPFAEGEVKGQVDVQLGLQGRGGTQALDVSGRGVKGFVEVKAALLDFGNVELGSPSVKSFSVHNPTLVATPLSMAFTGLDSDEFSASDAQATLQIEPGQTRDIPVAFNPARLGAANATLQLDVCANCEKARVELNGTGIASRLEITPMRLDFGRVALGATSEQKVSIRNLGGTPFDFSGAVLMNNPGGEFKLLSVPKAQSLAPGQALEVTASFTPRIRGVIRGTLLELGVLAPGTSGPGPKLPVLGEGATSCVSVSPDELDFGVVPEGVSVTREVEVENRCPRDIALTNAALATTLGGFFSLQNGGATLFVASGQSEQWRVTYSPKKSTPSSAGNLTFRVVDAQSFQMERVTLKGASKVFSPCTYSVRPVSLDYGRVAVGSQVTLGVAIQNTGTQDCFIASMGLASGTDPEFSSTPKTPGVLAPGAQAVLPIQFQPQAVASYTGLAEAWVNHPTLGHVTWTLDGTGVQSCFTLQPTEVDFGTTQLSCGPRTRTVTAHNGCNVSLTLSSAAITQTTSTELSLSPAPALPATLAPGSSLDIRVKYTPGNDGDDYAALAVNAGLGGPHNIGIHGKGFSANEHTDHFLQKNQTKVDVLWVVDNSGSMVEEQTSLAQYFAGFLNAAQMNSIDYHIAVTTTGIEPITGGWYACPGGANGGEAGRLFPADGSMPRIITPSTPNATEVFANNVQVGLCHWNEQGLEAAYRALSSPLINGADDPSTSLSNDGNAGFLRPDARLVIVFVSDEEDFSPESPAFYETFFKSVKNNDPSLLSISAIVGPANLEDCPSANSAGLRYLQLVSATNGAADSICTPNWANTLSQLSSSAFEQNRRFWLTEKPRAANALTVRVNGLIQAAGWTYDPLNNAVVFDPDQIPDVGATVDVTYPLACL